LPLGFSFIESELELTLPLLPLVVDDLGNELLLISSLDLSNLILEMLVEYNYLFPSPDIFPLRQDLSFPIVLHFFYLILDLSILFPLPIRQFFRFIRINFACNYALFIDIMLFSLLFQLLLVE
jgi:hypothetical protein